MVTIPTEQQRHAMKPTALVLFSRTFFPYQVLRFILINLRMIKMIWMSHRGARHALSAPAVQPPALH